MLRAIPGCHVPVWRWRGAMAGTHLHLSLVGRCCSPAARSGPGCDIHGYPGAFGLILNESPCPQVVWWQQWLQGQWHICPKQFSHLPSSSSFLEAALPGSQCEPALTICPGTSSGTAGSEGTADTGRPWWYHTNTRGILLITDPWRHLQCWWVSFTASRAMRLRAAFLGSLLLGHVAFQTGCSFTRKVLSAALWGSRAPAPTPTTLRAPRIVWSARLGKWSSHCTQH